MDRIRRKLISPANAYGWPQAPARRDPPPASNSDDRQSLASEYQDWARWLDGLRQAAAGGEMAHLRALAHGKLRFLLRRSLLLRDNTMLGIRHHAQLGEAGSLIKEFEQLIGELTGRATTAEDEWPLPSRLYEPPVNSSQGGRLPGERRQQPGRQNRLDGVSLDLALQVHNNLQLTLRLLQQHGSLAGNPQMQQAAATLSATAQLGHLLHDSA